MSREELEAAIWAAFTECKVTCSEPVRFVDKVVGAAVQYAAGDDEELTAMRRAVLDRDSR